MSKSKIALIFIPVFLILILLGQLISYQNLINKPIGKNIYLNIPLGSSKILLVSELSKDLKLNALQKNHLKVYVFLNKNLPFQAGEYEFNENTTFKNVFSSFKGGTFSISVRFLEGWNVEENTLFLKDKMGEEFASKYYTLAKPKEGTLFPDTYFIDKNTSPEQLVAKQTALFEKKTKGLFTNYSGGLSKQELIILASILERESSGIQDSRVIASILSKRYLEGMLLDADATTQYAKTHDIDFNACLTNNSCIDYDFWPSTLTNADLDSTNPYNTRYNLGLPPTPISNPSITSFESITNPLNTAYYYYLHDSSGVAHYAETLDQHIANIANFL